MASKVFGSPVTKTTLEALQKDGIREYEGREITRHDLALEAVNMMDADNKAAEARASADKLLYKTGANVGTKCLIYNATGDTIRFIRSHSWAGHFSDDTFPAELANGQWGVFLHTKDVGAPPGWSGAVVYRLKAPEGCSEEEVDLLTAWSTACGRWYDNNCYAEISEKDYFNDAILGDIIEIQMKETTGRECVTTYDLFQATVSITDTTTPVFEAVIQLGRPSPS